MRPFTDAELQILRQHAASHTGQQLADMLGRTKDSVYMKAVREGISMKKAGINHYRLKYPEDEVELCRQLHEEGLTVAVIADKMEMPRNYVSQLVNFRKRRPR